MPCNYKNYPPNWFTEIRPRILERAKNCCENCGLKNYRVIRRLEEGKFEKPKFDDWQTIKIMKKNGQKFNKAIKNLGLTKIVLTIAHLDHDKENFEVKDDRLKALCQRCHLLLDKEHHAEKRRETINKKKGLKNLF